jgi:hypothetical protein
MRSQIRTSIATFLIVSIMIIGSLSLVPFALADDSVPENVPAPWATESHRYNYSDGDSNTSNYNYETWGITITHGDIKIGLSARNYTNGNGYYVDYGQNIMFNVGPKFYIAMFTIDQVVFVIGNDTLMIPLRNCADFTLTYSPVKYDGIIPTIECNITYKDVRAYPDNPGSTFDLTILNHFRGDWNQTSIKVEALLDFSDMTLSQYTAGTNFTAEIHYIMQLTDPSLKNVGPPDFNTVKPSRYTDTSLEYDVNPNSSSAYTLSKLEMNDNFTINDGTGTHSAIGFSRMDSPNASGANGQTYNHNARVVTHGFPNLTYKDTLSMKSDPEITVYHDRVTANAETGNLILMAAIGAIAAVAAIGSVVFVRKRKKNRHDKDEKGPKNP